MLGESVEGELLTEFAGAVLVRKHPLDPEGILGRLRHPPAHGHNPFVRVTFGRAPGGTVFVGPDKVLIGESHPVTIHEHLGLARRHGLAERFPHRHIPTGGNVHVDARSQRQASQGPRVPVTAAR